jgi:hypothetical protein
MALEKVIGPVRGLHVALRTCPAGESGKQYLGHYKICPSAPVGFAEAQGIEQGHSDLLLSTASDALAAGEAGALIRISRLRPLATEVAGYPLLSFLYVSSLTARFESRQLAPWLPAASLRNRMFGLTSVLVHHAGNLMHYLEGPPLCVERKVASIRQDARHKGVIELLREPIADRAFPHWDLKYFCPELRPSPSVTWGKEVFGHGDTLVPAQRSPALTLLSDFWERASR